MENRFKVRISSMFKSSFGSCRSKNIDDVASQKPQSNQNRQHYQLIELFSPKPPRPFPSICKPKCSESPQTEEGCTVNRSLLPRSKISERQHLLDFDNGRKCPPVSPVSPLSSLYAFQECDTQTEKPKERKRNKKKAKKQRSRSRSRCDIADFPGFNYNGLFSSDEEDEDDDKTTLFSSRSLSSDSSESFRRRNNAAERRKRAPAPAPAAKKEPLQRLQEGRVRGSLAVVKRSSDPYSDFRTSMVEMIVERQIFSAKDLENMLQCFLLLNSYHHHRIIIEVFTEIWEALFSNWS